MIPGEHPEFSLPRRKLTVNCPSMLEGLPLLERPAAAADAVAGFDGTMLLEPLSGLHGYPLRNAADTFEAIQRVAGHHP